MTSIYHENWQSLKIRARPGNETFRKTAWISLLYTDFKDVKEGFEIIANPSDEKLSQLSDKVYLATPNSQVLHFFNDAQISSLFTSEKY